MRLKEKLESLLSSKNESNRDFMKSNLLESGKLQPKPLLRKNLLVRRLKEKNKKD